VKTIDGFESRQKRLDDFHRASVDTTPWAHPFLTSDKIARFRTYSERVWAAALARRIRKPRRFNAAFAVNIAQNMYKWARLAQKYGGNVTLYLNPQDTAAISRPEWEEFDGEFVDLLEGAAFLREHPGIAITTPCLEAPNEGSEFWAAHRNAPQLPAWQQRIKDGIGRVSPEHGLSLFSAPEVAALRRRAPTVRHVPLLSLRAMYPYFSWAEVLSRHDVTYIASTPFPAYASGKPYCICSVGGDLQFDCGRSDDLGRAMRMAFGSARFILASNPHTLGHCRRLGLTNALYLPYPMDSDDYCPGEGTSRADWVARFGGDVFILTTARIDSRVKGQTSALQLMLFRVAEERPSVRFLFLGWGSDAEELKARSAERGLQDRVIILPPVGKKRLIDYYRSCDVVLDQFVYGYLGATALEAASVGKPVVMKLRAEQYAPLYRDDVAPVEQASTPGEVRAALLGLIDSADRRSARGRLMRDWLLRNHGEQKTAPLLLALLQFVADRVRLPHGLDNPLSDPLSAEEREYHEQCRT
jgi:glycosyltransferase involved in cell wall biosynthesis